MEIVIFLGFWICNLVLSDLNLSLDLVSGCNYRKYMRRQELTLTKIGNSKGIRIPATVLKKYGIEEKLILEQRLDEIVLKPMRNSGNLSWHQTILEMAREQ